jgi:hypothetical protein
LVASFLVGAAPLLAADAPDQKTLEKWAANNPEASQALGEWVKARPNAAKLFFQWDGKHPEKSREFVTWTIEYANKDIKDFADKHPDWPVFSDIFKNHKPAANEFMAWARKYPQAALSLMKHSRGLHWAGDHLYKGFLVQK